MPSCGSIPTVSVIIPTRFRPELLKRAIAGALDQTRMPLEVVVVIDGDDPETKAVTSSIADSRVRIVALDQSVGGAAARNIGVQNASGEWIAFLDDDDEWLPTKLEKQLEAAAGVSEAHPIISCKILARRGDRTDVWPLRSPVRPYSEYLLVRKRIRYGEGVLQTSTLVARRTLLVSVPFRNGLRKYQDWDWILRATALKTTRLVFVDEPLSIWRLDDGRKRVSQQDDWQMSLSWIQSVRHFVTRRAYASFIANYVMRQACAARAWRVAPALLKEAIVNGNPGALDVAALILPWLVSAKLIRLLRRALLQHSPADGKVLWERM